MVRKQSEAQQQAYSTRGLCYWAPLGHVLRFSVPPPVSGNRTKWQFSRGTSNLIETNVKMNQWTEGKCRYCDFGVCSYVQNGLFFCFFLFSQGKMCLKVFVSVYRPTERERTERLIKMRLREIMMQKDLENVTCKEVRSSSVNDGGINCWVGCMHMLTVCWFSAGFLGEIPLNDLCAYWAWKWFPEATDAIYHQPKVLVFGNET